MTASMIDDGRMDHAGPSPQHWATGGRVRWVLVADRNPLLREGLRLYLETLGWEVVAGGTMEEGLALLAQSPAALSSPIVPDLIVLGETGPERREAGGPWPSVFDRLTAMRSAVRPVLLSIAAANHDLMVRARNRGFEAIHIDMPPLNLEELLLGCVRRIERG
ncbi:response regulator [Azospirillum sp. TSA6c]|uniref:response regulator n=1 Tax=unclassified Azospirillum TaxID=2630922 RepID=UPI000D60DD32|nr:response regulator [Azospirillum sp. TSA6c]PWC48034.1 hypothetical protein TSA6c_16350 [Azospirillum sp. TSA6c]PWC53679.1 hypothetical protein TSA6c_01875 [Azospirillum sp. TSA6c]